MGLLESQLNTSDESNLVVLRKRDREDAEMDITPMIDINFLLLIFFLVCSTADQLNSVQIPPAYFGTTVSERDSVVITVDGSGMDSVVYLGGNTSGSPLSSNREIQEKELLEAVESGFREGKDTVVLRACGELFQAEIDRIETIIGTVEGVRTLHLAVKEVK